MTINLDSHVNLGVGGGGGGGGGCDPRGLPTQSVSGKKTTKRDGPRQSQRIREGGKGRDEGFPFNDREKEETISLFSKSDLKGKEGKEERETHIRPGRRGKKGRKRDGPLRNCTCRRAAVLRCT